MSRQENLLKAIATGDTAENLAVSSAQDKQLKAIADKIAKGIPIDDELNIESENPVQNKILTNNLSTIVNNYCSKNIGILKVEGSYISPCGYSINAQNYMGFTINTLNISLDAEWYLNFDESYIMRKFINMTDEYNFRIENDIGLQIAVLKSGKKIIDYTSANEGVNFTYYYDIQFLLKIPAGTIVESNVLFKPNIILSSCFDKSYTIPKVDINSLYLNFKTAINKKLLKCASGYVPHNNGALYGIANQVLLDTTNIAHDRIYCKVVGYIDDDTHKSFIVEGYASYTYDDFIALVDTTADTNVNFRIDIKYIDTNNIICICTNLDDTVGIYYTAMCA